MDGSHFDTLARSIAYGGTRRRLMIRLLGGVVLGAPLALLGQGDSTAKGKNGHGKKGGGRGRAPTAMGIAAGRRVHGQLSVPGRLPLRCPTTGGPTGGVWPEPGCA